MNIRTETFDPPVIRVRIADVSFPKRCPVCGDEATVFTKMTFSQKRRGDVRPYWNPSLSAHGATQSNDVKTNTLFIPTCEDHHYTGEGETKYRMLCILGDGLLFSILFFSVLTTGGDLWLGRGIPSHFFGSVLLFVLSIGLTIVAFRPPDLLDAVKLVGFDNDFKYMWLDLKDESYRMAFLQKNRMNAELVRWIKRI